MLNKVGSELELAKHLLPAALSASVSLSPQLENAYFLEQRRAVQQIGLFFPPPLALAYLLIFNQCADLKRLSSWPVFSPVSPSRFSLPCFVWTVWPLSALLFPDNFCAQKHQVQFFSPCHQTKTLSCPLLPVVISVTHLLNLQASLITRQMSLLVLSWNIFYAFCECICLYIFL